MTNEIKPTRSRAGAHARQLAMYLANVALSVSQTEVAACFKRDRATVRHALRQIETARDDPGFNRLVERLETAAVSLLDALEAPTHAGAPTHEEGSEHGEETQRTANAAGRTTRDRG